MKDPEQYLKETYFFDYNSTQIQEHLNKAIAGQITDNGRLTAWYLYVRDQWSYNPYKIYLNKKNYRASEIAERKSGHCIDKSIIFISGARAMNIPATLHLAKVKNHISAERITEKYGTDELAPHGFADVYFNGQWTKASPIFDQPLCKHLNVAPLDYDGTKDSIFQEFDKEGGQFMEYLEDYGSFDDVPVKRIQEIMLKVYGSYAEKLLAKAKDGLVSL